MHFLVFSILLLYLWPLFLHPENLYIAVFDNLDSPFVIFKILAESGKLFDDSMEIIPNMMNGLPRLSYGSEFNVIVWLFVLFKPITAYVINETVIHFTAYIGMYLLLNNIILHKVRINTDYHEPLSVAVALLFALLPFWEPSGLSVAGMPLMLYAFMNIRSRQDRHRHWLILALLPLYSNFVICGVFFLGFIFFIFIRDWIILKHFNRPMAIAMMMVTIINLGINYRLVETMLLPSDYVSHRTEFFRDFVSFLPSYRFSHLLFLNGQEHTGCFQAHHIIPMIVFALMLTIFRLKIKRYLSFALIGAMAFLLIEGIWDTLLTQKYSIPLLILLAIVVSIWSEKEGRILGWLFILQITISYWQGFWTYEAWIPLINSVELLKTFDFSRFYFLQPMLWFIMFAIASFIVISRLQFGILLVIGTIIAQGMILFQHKTFSPAEENARSLTYSRYYAGELFKQIETDIGKQKETYRVASFGIQPAVTLYNGFYTIDGYITNYPLHYKHEFFQVIEKALSQKPENRLIFQNWGSKCYLVGGPNYQNYQRGLRLNEITIDVSALSKMGVEYIISGYKIPNAENLGLISYRSYEDYNTSFWDVHVYLIRKTHA